MLDNVLETSIVQTSIVTGRTPQSNKANIRVAFDWVLFFESANSVASIQCKIVIEMIVHHAESYAAILRTCV